MPLDLVEDKVHTEDWRKAIINFEVAKKYINANDKLKIYRGTDDHLRWGPSLTEIIRQIENFVNDPLHKSELL
jgi:hypothetical protein